MKGCLLLLLVGAMCLATGQPDIDYRLSLNDVKRAIQLSFLDYKRAIIRNAVSPSTNDNYIRTDAGADPTLLKSFNFRTHLFNVGLPNLYKLPERYVRNLTAWFKRKYKKFDDVNLHPKILRPKKVYGAWQINAQLFYKDRGGYELNFNFHVAIR